MSRGNVYKLYQKINQDIKNNPESFNTGLVGEALIIASYKQMPVEKLEKIHFIIGKLIKKKKELLRQKNDAGNVEHLVDIALSNPNDKDRSNNEI